MGINGKGNGITIELEHGGHGFPLEQEGDAYAVKRYGKHLGWVVLYQGGWWAVRNAELDGERTSETAWTGAGASLTTRVLVDAQLENFEDIEQLTIDQASDGLVAACS